MKRKWMILAVLWIFVSIGWAKGVKHPSLLYTPERIAMAKQRIKEDSVMANAWIQLEESARQRLQRKQFTDLDYLSLTYLMTGEKPYVECIKEILHEVIQARTFGSEEMLARKPAWRADLGLAHKAYLTAIAYDAAWDNAIFRR